MIVVQHVRRVVRAATDLVFGGAQIVAVLIAAPAVRRVYNRYGATDAELRQTLPGDELVTEPKLGYTRAITVGASPQAVWPWLAQIGQGRGGFYSFDMLENLIGCGIHSADRVLPDHQHLAVGDLVRSGRDDQPCWQVMDVDPQHHLVLLGAGTPDDPSVPEVVDEVPEHGYVASTWQWVLQPRAGGRCTRLVVRQRATFSSDQSWLWHLVEPLTFVMERRMLRGIRRRAERSP